MIKFLINLVEIAVILKIAYHFGMKGIIRRLSGKKRKKGLLSKVVYLSSKKLHYHLDNAINVQKAKKLADGGQQVANSKVININSKRVKAN